MTWVEKYWRVCPGGHISSSTLHDPQGHDGLKMFYHLRLPQVSEEGCFFPVGSLGSRRNHTGSRAPNPCRGDMLQALPLGSPISFSSDLRYKLCSLSSRNFFLTLAVSNMLVVISRYTILQYLGSLTFFCFYFFGWDFFFPSCPSLSFWVTLLPQISPSHT